MALNPESGKSQSGREALSREDRVHQAQSDAFERSRQAEQALPAQRLLSSDDLGWRTVLVRTYRDAPMAEEFSTAQTPDLLVVLVTSGTYVIESRKGRFWHRAGYHPGSVGVTAPDNVSVLRWRSTSSQPLESLHVHIAAGLLEETSRSFDGHGPRPARRFPDVLSLEDPLVTAAGRALGRALRERACTLYADSIAQTLAVHLLYRARGELAPPAPAPGPATLSARALSRVTAYMRERLHEDITLDDLAAQANLSKYHLLRVFAKSTGFTPYRYLTRLRLRHAADLLRDTPQTVLQISIACGYRSPGQFAAAFRRQYGASPTEFRRHHQR